MQENFFLGRPAVKLQNVSKVYQLYDAPIQRLKQAIWRGRRHYHHSFSSLTDIDLEVFPSQTLGIVGCNGAGKSTLLQIIAGVLQPSTGTVTVNGRITALLELGAGFDPEYTGRENARMNAAVLGLSKAEIDDRLPGIIDFAGIGEFIDQPTGIYSSGMVVRLAFAVATSVDPDILIIDEALAVGDAAFQFRCYERLRQVKASGKTIIFVSHDMGSVQAYCDRAILLDKGRIVFEGVPRDVAAEYQRRTRLSAGEERLAPVEVDIGNRISTGEADIIGWSINGYSEQGVCISPGSELTLRLKVRFNEDIEDPLVGFHIDTIKGIQLVGNSNHFEDKKLPGHKKGDVVDYEIVVPTPFHPGDYVLSTAVAYARDGEIVRTDHWQRFATFTITKRKTLYYGLLDVEVSISEAA